MFKVSLLSTNTIEEWLWNTEQFSWLSKASFLLGVIWNCKDVDALWDAGKLSKNNALIQGIG